MSFNNELSQNTQIQNQLSEMEKKSEEIAAGLPPPGDDITKQAQQYFTDAMNLIIGNYSKKMRYVIHSSAINAAKKIIPIETELNMTDKIFNTTCELPSNPIVKQLKLITAKNGTNEYNSQVANLNINRLPTISTAISSVKIPTNQGEGGFSLSYTSTDMLKNLQNRLSNDAFEQTSDAGKVLKDRTYVPPNVLAAVNTTSDAKIAHSNECLIDMIDIINPTDITQPEHFISDTSFIGVFSANELRYQNVQEFIDESTVKFVFNDTNIIDIITTVRMIARKTPSNTNIAIIFPRYIGNITKQILDMANNYYIHYGVNTFGLYGKFKTGEIPNYLILTRKILAGMLAYSGLEMVLGVYSTIKAGLGIYSGNWDNVNDYATFTTFADTDGADVVGILRDYNKVRRMWNVLDINTAYWYLVLSFGHLKTPMNNLNLYHNYQLLSANQNIGIKLYDANVYVKIAEALGLVKYSDEKLAYLSNPTVIRNKIYNINNAYTYLKMSYISRTYGSGINFKKMIGNEIFEELIWELPKYYMINKYRLPDQRIIILMPLVEIERNSVSLWWNNTSTVTTSYYATPAANNDLTANTTKFIIEEYLPEATVWRYDLYGSLNVEAPKVEWNLHDLYNLNDGSQCYFVDPNKNIGQLTVAFSSYENQVIRTITTYAWDNLNTNVLNFKLPIILTNDSICKTKHWYGLSTTINDPVYPVEVDNLKQEFTAGSQRQKSILETLFS